MKRQPLDIAIVAEEPLDRIDAHRGIEHGAIAGAFARVIAHPAHDRGKRIFLRQLAPCRLIIAVLGEGEPALDILAGRACITARRKAPHIFRPQRAPRAGAIGKRGAGIEFDGEWIPWPQILMHPRSPHPASHNRRYWHRRLPANGRRADPPPCRRRDARSAPAASDSPAPEPYAGSCGHA